VLTSSAVAVPCSFCPLRSFRSSSSNGWGSVRIGSSQLEQTTKATHLARLGKLLGALPVSASVASGDEVGDTGRLVGERVGLGALEELQAEPSHLLQTDTEDGGLGVSTETETVDETGREGDDVFQSAREGDTRDVGDAVDVEDRGGVEDGVPQLGVDRRGGSNSGLAELSLGDWIMSVFLF
jgi:hypothetical protein